MPRFFARFSRRSKVASTPPEAANTLIPFPSSCVFIASISFHFIATVLHS
jgi:hypothetical protein